MLAGDLQGKLEAAGFALRRVVLYEAKTAAALSHETRMNLALGGIDMVLLFSPRTAQPGASLLNPDALARMLRDLNEMSQAHSQEGRPIPLVTPPSLRIGVRRLIEPVLPSLPVISLAELPTAVNLHSVGMWEMQNAA